MVQDGTIVLTTMAACDESIGTAVGIFTKAILQLGAHQPRNYELYISIDWVDVLHPVMHTSSYMRCTCKGHGVG